jgi:phosphohistidine phosphatase
MASDKQAARPEGEPAARPAIPLRASAGFDLGRGAPDTRGMPTLYIVRHAWAEERDAERWPADDLRPLTRPGQKRFRRLVRRLAERGFAPELVATSPLVRCRQTAEIIREELPGRPAVVRREELAPGGDLEELLAWTAGEEAALAWVGHAPDVGRHLAALLGAGAGAIEFAKGAVACVDFEDREALGRGRLRWLATAKIAGV